MRISSLRICLVGLTFAASLFASGPAPSRTPRPEPKHEREREEKEERERASRPDRIGPALEKRIAGKAKLDDVRVDVAWSRDDGMTSARVYGDGVGIWNRQAQFRLPKEKVLALLKTLRAAKFGAMPDWFGESEGEEGPRLKGRIEVVAGPISKSVIQLFEGDQSEEFAALAQKLLEVCVEPARAGVGATSLADGLQKVATGELAPQALAVTVQRRSAASPGSDDAGFIVHLEGRRVLAETLPAGKIVAPPKVLTLPKADFRELAKLLAESKAAEIPLNVYGTEYTDLELGVLRWSRAISARRFLNMNPTSKGEAQVAFDRLFEAFRAVNERARKEGESVASSSAPAEKAKEKPERQKTR